MGNQITKPSKSHARTTIKISHHESVDDNHIMISYNWDDSIAIAHKVCDELRRIGYTVWIDRDHMHGDLYRKMAFAVEHSFAVVIFMSSNYELSENCESEASYAKQLKKRIIPVFTQKGYKPTGLCGLLAAGKIYTDFSKGTFDDNFRELVKQLKDPVQRYIKEESIKSFARKTRTQQSNIMGETPSLTDTNSVKGTISAAESTEDSEHSAVEKTSNSISQTQPEVTSQHSEEVKATLITNTKCAPVPMSAEDSEQQDIDQLSNEVAHTAPEIAAKVSEDIGSKSTPSTKREESDEETTFVTYVENLQKVSSEDEEDESNGQFDQTPDVVLIRNLEKFANEEDWSEDEGHQLLSLWVQLHELNDISLTKQAATYIPTHLNLSKISLDESQVVAMSEVLKLATKDILQIDLTGCQLTTSLFRHFSTALVERTTNVGELWIGGNQLHVDDVIALIPKITKGLDLWECFADYDETSRNANQDDIKRIQETLNELSNSNLEVHVDDEEDTVLTSQR